MIETIKQEIKPDIILKLGNNTYYFNYDIKPVFITTMKEDSETTIEGWEFLQVYLQGQPNYNDCVRAVIRKYVTQEEEFDLINSYNKAVILNQTLSPDITNYKNYLKLVDNIKNTIKKVFNE